MSMRRGSEATKRWSFPELAMLASLVFAASFAPAVTAPAAPVPHGGDSIAAVDWLQPGTVGRGGTAVDAVREATDVTGERDRRSPGPSPDPGRRERANGRLPARAPASAETPDTHATAALVRAGRVAHPATAPPSPSH